MFKKLFKARREAPKQPAGKPGKTECYGVPSPVYSVNPVEYGLRSPPTGVPSPAYSLSPVEYGLLSPPPGVPGPPMQLQPNSPSPVAYQASAPEPTPKQVTQPKTAVHPHRLNKHDRPSNAHVLPSKAQPQELPAGTQTQSKVVHSPNKLKANNQPQGPIELPASAPPSRYELPNVSTPRPNHDAGWKSPGGFSTTTTLVPSPRSEAHSPRLGGPEHTGLANTHKDGDDGVKKFVLDVYCPLKRDAHGNRREQIPRDAREFRLAKVALIPIVAGKRTFVSFDVVFGEVDESYARLVKKHFSFSQETHIEKMDAGRVNADLVYVLGPLKIAYRDGDQSEVYMKFPSVQERDKFEETFWSMWQYVEQLGNDEAGRIA